MLLISALLISHKCCQVSAITQELVGMLLQHSGHTQLITDLKNPLSTNIDDAAFKVMVNSMHSRGGSLQPVCEAGSEWCRCPEAT